MITRQDIVDAARQYVGIPFKKGGRDRFGIDCVGLLVLVGRDVGIELKDTISYAFGPEPNLMKEFVQNQSIRRPPNPPRSGYIGLFRQSVYPMHTGIIAKDSGQTMLINANLKERRVVEQDFADWRKEIIEFRDFIGVE